MADDAEKIAMVIETQAQLAGLRQASAETSAFQDIVNAGKVPLEAIGTAATDAAAKVTISAAQQKAAWAQAGGSVHDYNAIIAQMAAAQRQSTVAAAQTAQATNAAGVAAAGAAASIGGGGAGGGGGLNPAMNRLNPNMRSGALAASRLALAMDGMGGGVAGVARSVGTLSYGLSDLGGPKMALFASGLAAGAIAIATLTELVIKEHDEVTKAGEAFENHLHNLEFRAAKAEVDDLNKKIGETTTKIQQLTYWQTVSYELYHRRPDGQNFFKSMLDDIYHLVTGTTDLDDQLKKLQNESNDATKVKAEKGAELAKSQADENKSLNDYYTTQRNSLAVKIQQLTFQQSENTLAGQRAGLAFQSLAMEDEIKKRYELTNEQRIKGVSISAAQLAQRAKLLDSLSTETKLQDQIYQQEQERRRVAANAQQSGIIATAQGDLDNPGARLAAERIKAERDAAAAHAKGEADSELIDEAHRQRDLRAWRDYYQQITDAARQSEQDILAARNDIDPDADDAAQRLKVWQNYYDNLGKLGVNQVNLARVTNAQIARLDRDRVNQGLNELKASTAAYQGHAGAVAAIAKGVNDAIRKYEIAVQVVKDVQQAKSQFAAGVADTATGNFTGAALHFTASGLFAAAAAFGAAEALGAGGGASGGGSGSGGAQQSTFTPSDANKSGGQVVNLYTVNPFSREVTAAVAYYLDLQGTLKVPIQIPPTFGLTGRAA